MYKPAIYISHAWGGKSEEIVGKIMKKFSSEGIEITMDKKDLGYRQSINDFMLNLGAADAIIIVVSNKYLHSEYCMFELLQIYKNKNILDRIFPVVLDEVSIAKSTDRLDLVKFWETQTNELENKIRALDSISNIEGITDDLNLYKSIRNNIAHLTAILKDINTLNITLHQQSDFDELFKAVAKKVNQNQKEEMAKAIETVSGTPHESPMEAEVKAPSKASEMDLRANIIKGPETTSKKRKNRLPLLLGLLGIFVLGYFGISLIDSSESISNNDSLSALNEKPIDQELGTKSTEKDLDGKETKINTPPVSNIKQSIPSNDASKSSPESANDLEAIKKDVANVNKAPDISNVKKTPVKIFLDRSITKATILINGKPIADFGGSKTLNIIEAELPIGNQEFTIMNRNDTCRVFRQIREGEEEVTLNCN